MPPACSRDPNDIIGPAGVGPARWIPVDLDIHYRIRFENVAEATADARSVFIEHALDANIDLTSFRLEGFGFRNREFTIPEHQAVHQQRIDLSDDLGIYVDVVFGLDIVNRRVIWNFLAIDPATNAPPTDSLIGVVPPNPENGTEGQGFVTFKVRANADTPTGTRVYADAVIVFDDNAPIVTPQIFNTIDAGPVTSVLLLQSGELSRRVRRDSLSGPPVLGNQIILSVSVNESGSSVVAVDLYARDAADPYTPWFFVGTATDASPYVAFEGNAGVNYAFVSVGQSASGIREAVTDNVTDVVSSVVETSICANDCTGNGFCYLGQCLCDRGYEGVDCSTGVSIHEPPILNVFPVPVVESGVVVPLLIYAQSPAAPSGLDVRVRVTGLPVAAELHADGLELTAVAGVYDLTQSDLTNLTARLPMWPHESNVSVRAMAYNDSDLVAITEAFVMFRVLADATTSTVASASTSVSPTGPTMAMTATPTQPPSDATTTITSIHATATTTSVSAGDGSARETSEAASDGVNVGAIGGIVVALLIVIGIIVFVFAARRKRRQVKDQHSGTPPPAVGTATMVPGVTSTSVETPQQRRSRLSFSEADVIMHTSTDSPTSLAADGKDGDPDITEVETNFGPLPVRGSFHRRDSIQSIV